MLDPRVYTKDVDMVLSFEWLVTKDLKICVQSQDLPGN